MHFYNSYAQSITFKVVLKKLHHLIYAFTD